MNISKSETDSKEERGTLPSPPTLVSSISNASKGTTAFPSTQRPRDGVLEEPNSSATSPTRRIKSNSVRQMLSEKVRPLQPFPPITLHSDLIVPRTAANEQNYEQPLFLPSVPASIFHRHLPPISVGQGSERLSITIPHHGPDISDVVSSSSSLLMTSSSQCLTPSSPVAGFASSVTPWKSTGKISSVEVSKILFLNDDSCEEEKIDVCTVKESHKVSASDRIVGVDDKGHSVQETDEDGTEANEKESISHFYSYLGSQCSRTIPSLMKYYSRHKRSLATSLSVALGVSDQATPPCSPISPGTLPSLQKRSLEASTMTSPTDRSLHGSSEYFPSLMSSEQQKLSVESSRTASCKASSSLSALTLLTIPNLTAEKSSPIAKLSPLALSKVEEERRSNEKDDDSTGIKITCTAAPPDSIENSSVDSPVCTIPPGLSFPSPWPISHNTIPHPGSYWLHSGVDTGAGLNLGYQVARDPLTGHLFILSRPHPMTDPNSHGLMWAGYGGVPAPPMMMTPQQLLLDPRYRSSLHHPPPPPPPPPSIMQMHHAHPGMHHQQQQQPMKNVSSTKETAKKSPNSISEEVSNHTTDMSLQTLPPPNISPHFLYPPTTIPYYYTQPPHPNPFGLSAFTQRTMAASGLGLPSPLQSALLTPLTSNLFTASSSTTTTTSESLLLTEKCVSNNIVSNTSITSEDVALKDNNVPLIESKSRLFSEQRTVNSIKSAFEAHTLEGKCPPHVEHSFLPRNIFIKEERQDEENQHSCLAKKECKRSLSSDNLICLKVESNDVHTSEDDSAVNSNSPCPWQSSSYEAIKPNAFENNTSDVHDVKVNTKLSSKELPVNSSVGINFEKNDSLIVPLSVPKTPIDSSGLELLLETFLQHGDRLALSPAKDSDQDSVSSVSEQMPLLEREKSTPSPRVSPASFESQPPVLTPFTLSAEMESPIFSIPIIHPPVDHVIDPKPFYLPPKPSGLSVLCALAEQRILEEQQNSCSALSSLAEVASSTPSVPMSPLPADTQQKFDNLTSNTLSPDQEETPIESSCCNDGFSGDSNRIFNDQESDHEETAFIFKKSPQNVSASLTDVKSTSTYQVENGNAVEMGMKLKLEDLRRQYRLKQRELSRLRPKRDIFASVRRRRGRPPKTSSCSSRIVGMKRKAGRPFKNLRRFSSVIQRKSDDLEIQQEAHDVPSFMQTSDPSSMQKKTQSNTNVKSRQPKMEESSDEDEAGRASSPSSTLSFDHSCQSLFKSPYLLISPKQEEQEGEHNSTDMQQDKDEKVETSMESSTSDAEFHSISSSSKKRKPGRPKKHPSTKFEATETIVAKKPKGFEFLLVSHKTKIRPKLKAELRIRSYEQDDDISCVNSQANNKQVQKDETEDVKDEVTKTTTLCRGLRRRGAPMGRTSLTRNTLLRDKEKRKSVFEKNSRMQELFRSLKRYSTTAAAEHDESEDEKDEKEYRPYICKKGESLTEEEVKSTEVKSDASARVHQIEETRPESESGSETAAAALPLGESGVHTSHIKTEVDAAAEDRGSDPLPLSLSGIKETVVRVKEEVSEATTETEDNKMENSVCSLQVEDLIPGARLLILQDGLLYAGSLKPITPPDVYGILLDGERGTRPHIFCQEELLTQAWKEVKPGSTRFLTEGTRVCAFWSQQYRGLYPGCVAAACSPTHEGNHNLVNVEFDDGDSGRIHVDDIRLLPLHFPVIEYDPNPLMSLNKRKRRLTEEDPGDDRPMPSKTLKLKEHSNDNKIPLESIKDDGNSAVDQEAMKEAPAATDVKKEPRRKQKRKRIMKKSFSSLDDRKRRKKRKKCSDYLLGKHKHKRKHKRKRKQNRVFPHVEQGDNELRMRIKSPPPLKEEQISHEETSTEDEEEEDITAKSENEESAYQPQRRKKRSPSEKSKMAPFLLDRQLWRWFGKGYRRPGSKGKGKKLFYKEIVRGKEHIRVGDCAVFLSSGSHERPYIGKIDFLWEGWGGNMVVKVRWFYHPDETVGTERKLSEPKGALFSSSHTDENDVQTISHKCHVVSLAEYHMRRAELDHKYGQDYENFDLYYLAGFYDPTYSRITMEPGVS